MLSLILSLQKPDPVFSIPIPVLVFGREISVEQGHAAPAHFDFDGDGLKDLLVGQYEGGRLNFFRNTGTKEFPKFTAPKFVQAEGTPMAVEFG